MNVAELIARLREFDPDTKVRIGYDYGQMTEVVKVSHITETWSQQGPQPADWVLVADYDLDDEETA